MESNDESISFITAVCGCDEGRAIELLEAGGSVERAVEIHFSHSQDDKKMPAGRSQTHPSSQLPPPPRKRNKPNKIENTQQSSVVESSNLDDRKLQAFRNEDLLQEQQQKQSTNLTLNKPSPIKNKLTREDRLQYLRLAEAFTKMAETSKRLIKLDAIQNVLHDIIEAVGGICGDEKSRKDDAKVLQYAIELTVGSTLKLQVSGAAVSKAVMTVTGASSSQLRSSYRKTGDMGDVAAMYIRNQRLLVEPKPLSIVTVFQTLEKIASQTGKGSQNSRHILMIKLLRSCRSCEIRFLVRTLLGNMRLGANMRTVLAALAMAVNNNPATKDMAIKSVQDTFDFCPRIDKACLSLLVGGIPYMIKTCTLEVGTCITPMLANPAHSLEEVKKLMKSGSAIAEWKYDGVRCQAHFTGEAVKLFSRHMIENTNQFPDAVEFLLEAKNSSVCSFIIDAEIVGIENEEKSNLRLLPFQDLSTRRGNKTNDKDIQIKIFSFDLMYLNGQALVKHSLSKRRRLLLENFNITKGFTFAQSLSLPRFDEQIITNFLQTAISGGAEGLMVKLVGECEVNVNVESQILNEGSKNKLHCLYESGVRSHSWLKVKKDYVAGYADTIDCVPIGAWYGNGRKAQKGFLSPVLLAVYDEVDDVFRSISRCMSFTDAMYTAMYDFYMKGIPYPKGVGLGERGEIEIADESKNDADVNETQNPSIETLDDEFEPVNCYTTRPSALVVTNESPPIWFKPSEVFEVSFADLTLSKQHSAAAGLVDSSARGVAMRFPRFKRRRPDKNVDQATTSSQIAELFAKQTK